MSTGRLGLGVAVGLCLLSTVTGCSLNPFATEVVALPCPSVAGGPLTLVVGARANAPKPAPPTEIRGLIEEAAKQGSQIQVIRVDGQPGVALDARFRSDAKNEKLRQHELDAFVAGTVEVVTGLKPKVPEADVLGALTEAARATASGGTIVLLDSGLTTKGQLSFLQGDMFVANHDEVVRYLRDQRLMPDLTGRSIVLVGLGNTADPQPELGENLRLTVTALWQSVVTNAGATCVHAMALAGTRKSVDTDVPVSVVALPKAPEFVPCGVTVLSDTAVGFLPDQAVFRDPAGTKATLQALADQLLPGKQLVKLIGTTSSAGSSEAGRVELSKQRAEAVKGVLVSLGVSGDRITTVGAGSNGPNRVEDRGPDGSLLPGPAAQNRTVVVELTCPQ